ncbi:hypothetical protein B0H66DRAFT_50479 [Apodospora peruviana]|uniref:Uncharacterized protein n=1 Tax=Apodospora peruviana TaxID=516989 RepID=A0AAE0ISF0_9PEZI|nr:hypothetical protein B0H66DRAFT_50479 [Apodospora peruviana]
MLSFIPFPPLFWWVIFLVPYRHFGRRLTGIKSPSARRAVLRFAKRARFGGACPENPGEDPWVVAIQEAKQQIYPCNLLMCHRFTFLQTLITGWRSGTVQLPVSISPSSQCCPRKKRDNDFIHLAARECYEWQRYSMFTSCTITNTNVPQLYRHCRLLCSLLIIT